MNDIWRKILLRSLLVSAICHTGCQSSSRDNEVPPPPPEVEAQFPLIQPMKIYHDYVGHVEPFISVDVKAQISGILTKQFFTPGQFVHGGDPLLEIDPRPYQAQLAMAQAELEASNISLTYSKDKQTRYSPMAKQEYISQLTYDEYVSEVFANQALVQKNSAQVDLAKIQLGYCHINAPMDCMTGQLQVKPGNYVDASAETTLLVLNKIQPILVDFYVPENDLPLIQEKQQKKPLSIEVFLNQNHQDSVQGCLTLINNQVETQIGAILMEGTFQNDPLRLWPGQFVDVRLVTDYIPEAIVLPTRAIYEGPNGHYVYIVNNKGLLEQKPVEIEQEQNEIVIIRSGIEKNSLVVVSGVFTLKAGVPVRVRNTTPRN